MPLTAGVPALHCPIAVPCHMDVDAHAAGPREEGDPQSRRECRPKCIIPFQARGGERGSGLSE